MSALPNAVYTTAAMATSGKTVVLVSSGNSFGNYTEPRNIITFTSVLAAVTMSLFGSSNLPTAAYSAASMATAGTTVVLASSGNLFGNYVRLHSVVIPTGSSSPITYSISDTLSLSDSLSLSASIAVESISDTISLSDALSILNSLNAPSSDSLSLSYAITFSDVITLSDATTVQIAIPIRIPIWHFQQGMSGVLSGR